MADIRIGEVVVRLRLWSAAPHVLVVVSAMVSSAAAGCRYANCDHPVGDRCVDKALGGSECMTSADCASTSGVCDVAATGTCVQCTPDHAAVCGGNTPVCGDGGTCRACMSHGDCPLSNACVPALSDSPDAGSCVAPAEVAYVDPRGADNAICSLSAPCLRVAEALATGRPYIKFHGTIDEPVTVDHGRSATFLADPGAVLTSTKPSAGSQPVLTVQDDGTSLTVYDLAIADATDPSAVGVMVPQLSGNPSLTLTRVTIANNPGGGIFVAGGRLQLAQSIVRDNLGGGVVVNSPATFEIIGNAFIGNGAGDMPQGGIAISTVAAETNRLDFNTFYQNDSQAGIGAGLRCAAGGLIARNNIYFGNGSAGNHEQVSGPCAHEYSIVSPGTVPTGTNNTAQDPMFMNASAGNLHLQSHSPAIGAADRDSDLNGVAARDIDGIARKRPATLGAYQAP